MVFDRLQPSTSHLRPSVFRRIGKGKILKPSVFHRLKKDEQPRPLVVARIKIGKMWSSSLPSQKKDSVLSQLGELNEIQSSIPSRMKRVSNLDVRMDNSLKVKRCILVLTCYRTRVSPKERTLLNKRLNYSHIQKEDFRTRDETVRTLKKNTPEQ